MSSAAVLFEMPAPASRLARGPAPLITSAVAHLLSPSQVNEFLDCGARWYYHHALGIPDKRTVSLAIGEALHAVTAACLRIWHRGHDPVPGAAEHLRYQLTAALEQVDTEGEDLEALHQQAADMLAVWTRQVAPRLRDVAAAIELRMEGTIGGVRVQGTADVITEAGMVVDLKTSKRKPAGVSQSHRLQLATYCALADQASRGRRQHTSARLVTITKTKTPTAVPQTLEITDADHRYAEWAYRTAQEEMRAGSILPRRSSLLCSRDNCAYWQQCEDEYGGCVKE